MAQYIHLLYGSYLLYVHSFPQMLAWAKIPMTTWLRILGAFMAIVALLWFIWIHHSLGNNISVRLRIKDSQELITEGPYRLDSASDVFSVLSAASVRLFSYGKLVHRNYMVGRTNCHHSS